MPQRKSKKRTSAGGQGSSLTSPLVKRKSVKKGGKRKLSAYNIFMKKNLAPYKKHHPNASQKQAFKAVAKMWASAH